jgi:hypothetical protein
MRSLAGKAGLRHGVFMLTLGKFLTTLGILFAIVFAVIFSLATFVEPKNRDMGFTVRADKYIKQP